MKRWLVWAMALSAAYFASGLYVVRGNEQALVRRFGRARLPLAASGLHFDLPWPFTRIDRVNVNQVQTLSVGVPAEPPAITGFLRELEIDRQGEFLTGDKNILNLSVSAQYRVADPFAYLCRSEAPETGLKLLVESLVTDAVARSGVDYVHPLGLNELRELLTRRTREEADRQPWGILVEDVTIAGAFPPVEVKAAFLDVSNARAEKDRVIQQEQAQAEKRLAAAHATVREWLDRSLADRLRRVETARGSAERFSTIVAEFRRDAESAGQTPDAVRRRTMQRLFTAEMERLLPRFAGKVLVDPHDPVDLTLFPPPEPSPNRPRDNASPDAAR
jgi:membrane protease subunit HflK